MQSCEGILKWVFSCNDDDISTIHLGLVWEYNHMTHYFSAGRWTAQQDPAWQRPGSPEVALRGEGALLEDMLGKLRPPKATLCRGASGEGPGGSFLGVGLAPEQRKNHIGGGDSTTLAHLGEFGEHGVSCIKVPDLRNAGEVQGSPRLPTPLTPITNLGILEITLKFNNLLQGLLELTLKPDIHMVTVYYKWETQIKSRQGNAHG